MYWELVAESNVTVDGIGLLIANRTTVVSLEQAKLFEGMHGYKLSQSNFPVSVDQTLVLTDPEIEPEDSE